MFGEQSQDSVSDFEVAADDGRAPPESLQGQVVEPFIEFDCVFDGASMEVDGHRDAVLFAGTQGSDGLVNDVVGQEHVQFELSEDSVQHFLVHTVIVF